MSHLEVTPADHAGGGAGDPEGHQDAWGRVVFAGDDQAGADLPGFLAGAGGRELTQLLLRLLWPTREGGRLDVRAAAAALGVAPRSVYRWRAQGLPGVRADQLARLLAPMSRTLLREQLDERQARSNLERLALGRGRGRVPEQYGNTGWLDPHRVFVAHLDGTPLDRVVITREDPKLVTRAARGVSPDGSHFYLAHNRWHAQLIRNAVLRLPQHARARVELPPSAVGKGHTLTWLAAATSISELEWFAIAAHASNDQGLSS